MEDLKSSEVVADAVRAKENCDASRLFMLLEHKQSDYQKFMRAVFRCAGIKDPNESESGRGTESADDDHLAGEDVEPDCVSYPSSICGEKEVYGSPEGPKKNVLATDGYVSDTDKASLRGMHGNSSEYAVKGHNEEKRAGDWHSTHGLGINLPSGDQSCNFGLEDGVQNVVKSGNEIKGKGVVSGESESTVKLNKRLIGSQSESDAEAPAQKFKKSRKAVKGESGESKAIE